MSKSQPEPQAFAADQPGGVGLVDRPLQRLGLAVELAADVDVGGVRAHGDAGEQAALDQLVRLVPHDLPVLAGAGLALVGVDHQVVRPLAHLLRHERPLHAGDEAGAAAAAQTGLAHFVDDPVATLGDQVLGAVPVAARLRAAQARLAEAVEVGEDPVLVLQHQASPPAFPLPCRRRPGIDVKDVSPPIGSAPRRPICEPAFGVSPRASASRIASMLSGVRSS